MLWPNGTKSKPYVSSAFGPRRAPVAGASTNHKGTDFSHTFSAVKAVAGGVVKVAGYKSGWSGGGIQVWVQHDGFFTRSLHLSSVAPGIAPGVSVVEGQTLGTMGRTGTATDVHLHFEVSPGVWHSSNTGQVDPVTFINARLGSTAGGGSSPIGDDVMAGLTPDEQAELLRRVRNLDAQTTGAGNFKNSIAERVINTEAQVNGLPDALKAIKDQVNGAPTVLAAIREDIKGIKTTGGAVDVDALAATLTRELPAPIVKALGAALSKAG